MALPRRARPRRQPQSRSAEPARHIDAIAGPGSVTAQGKPARHGAADDNVAPQHRTAREVAAGKGSRIPPSQPQEPAIEAVDPAIGSRGGDRQRHQAEPRLPTYGGDIAKSARQSFVSYVLRPMRFGTKVHTVKE